MIDFIIKSGISMAVLLLIYHLLLENEKMHRFNRFYLLGAILLSFILPFISFNTTAPSVINTASVSLQELVIGNSSAQKEMTLNYAAIFWIVYIIVALVFLFRFIKNVLHFIVKVRVNQTLCYQNATLVLIQEKVLPHTFLNYIFVNREDHISKAIEDELYTHELAHIKQKHTIDIIFVEILKTLFWFNPLLSYYKKAIQLNHEFLADEKVISTHRNITPYQNLLLKKASGAQGFALASNLNFSITKKRLLMMTKTTNSLMALTKQLLLLPFIAVLIFVSCAKETQDTNEETVKLPEESAGMTSEEKIYSTGLTKQPEFEGGIQGFYKYVNKEFIIPEINEDLTAKIYMSFVVEKDGTMSNIKALRDPGHGLGTEAERVLKSITKKWSPGEIEGKKVRTNYNLPITINIKS